MRGVGQGGPAAPRAVSQVSEGSGTMLVVAVGEQSEWGKLMAAITDTEETETPLQASPSLVQPRQHAAMPQQQTGAVLQQPQAGVQWRGRWVGPASDGRHAS